MLNNVLSLKTIARFLHFLTLRRFTLNSFTLGRVFDPLSFDPKSKH